MANIIFQINGGLGKCIAATAVCSAIKKKYPDDTLIVVSGYPEVFLNNPNVKKTFAFGNLSYFYQDYIEGKSIISFAHDPYLESDFIMNKKHLIEVWCNLLQLPYNHEMPEFFITQREMDSFQSQVRLDKPMMIIQTNGGADQNKKYSWARDLPQCTVLPIIEEFKDKYAIVHIRREDQPSYAHTVPLTAQLRPILAMSVLSEKRLLIDSFMQHAMAALNLPSVACWIVNSPKVFGYEMHTHIISNPFTVKPELRNSYLSEFNIGGDELEFPYNSENEIFNVDSIIAALKDEKILFNKPNQSPTDGKIVLPK